MLEKESQYSLSVWVTPGRLNTLEWVDPHSGVYEHPKLEHLDCFLLKWHLGAFREVEWIQEELMDETDQNTLREILKELKYFSVVILGHGGSCAQV